MAMKVVRHFAPGSPDAAEYAHLSAANDAQPRQKLRPVDRSAEPRRLRKLSGPQAKMHGGLLRLAVERVKAEATDRKCQYLRRFDVVQCSGYRTYQQRWDALASLVEPLLARLDLATMVLGWLDNAGQFHLNRQRRLAEDSPVQEWTVSRTLGMLEDAGYVRRKFRRIFHNGKRWITRVTINIRPKFFIDLGLGYLLADARSQKKTQRVKKLAGVYDQRMAAAAVEKDSKAERTRSHQGHLSAIRKRETAHADEQRQAYSRRRNELRATFKAANGHLVGRVFEQAFGLAHPDYKLIPEHAYPAP